MCTYDCGNISLRSNYWQTGQYPASVDRLNAIKYTHGVGINSQAFSFATRALNRGRAVLRFHNIIGPVVKREYDSKLAHAKNFGIQNS